MCAHAFRLCVFFCLVLMVNPPALAQQDRPPSEDRPPTGERPTRDPMPPQRPREMERPRISGRILLPPGERRLPEMTTVSISSLGSGLQHMEVVRTDGFFEFRNLPSLPSGRYSITVNAPGWEPVQEDFDFQQGFGGSQRYVVLHLERKLPEEEEPLPPSGSQTISARQLAIPQAATREMERAARESARNRSEKAVEHIEKALEIHPDYYEAYNSLAREYLRQGRKDDALEALRTSLEIYSDDPVTHFNLGLILLRYGEVYESLAPLRRSVELDPNQAKAHLLMGEAYLNLGQFQLAIGCFRTAGRLQETDPTVHLGMGQAYLGLNDADRALMSLQRFLEMESEGERADQIRDLVTRIEASP